MVASSALSMASAVCRPFWRRRCNAPALPKGIQLGKSVLKAWKITVNIWFRMPCNDILPVNANNKKWINIGGITCHQQPYPWLNSIEEQITALQTFSPGKIKRKIKFSCAEALHFIECTKTRHWLFRIYQKVYIYMNVVWDNNLI